MLASQLTQFPGGVHTATPLKNPRHFLLCQRQWSATNLGALGTHHRVCCNFLYLDVLKTDQVLHLSSLPSATSSRCVLLPAPAEHQYYATAGSFRIGGAALSPLVVRVAQTLHGARETEYSAGVRTQVYVRTSRPSTAITIMFLHH
jgi:hypothetical protein